MTFSGRRKLTLTAALFVAAATTVVIAAATGSYVPLFLAFVPLLAVPWVLTREEPGEVSATSPAVSSGGDRGAEPTGGEPGDDGDTATGEPVETSEDRPGASSTD